LTINIALLLARRVQEDNTRLVGQAATLSAFFGQQARLAAQQAIEAPRSSDHAEMELPDDLFDQFVREVLNLPREEALTEAQREKVRAQIEANEVDIVPWLEQAGHGRRLSVRLKFVESSPAPRMAVQAARAAAPVAVQPRVVRVPQTRAQVAPAAPVVMARPRSLGWKIGNVAGWVAVPVLAVLVVVLWLPLQSREAIAQTQGFKSLPFQGLLRRVLLHAQTRTSDVTLRHGLWHSMEITAPKPTRLIATLELTKKLDAPVSVTVKIAHQGGAADVVEQRTITMDPSRQAQSLFSVHLSPGTYLIQCDSNEGVPADGLWGRLTLSATH
jgi:hypothetical protein